MTSQGSPTARFRWALDVENVDIALAAVAELPLISLEDALALYRLLAGASASATPALPLDRLSG